MYLVTLHHCRYFYSSTCVNERQNRKGNCSNTFSVSTEEECIQHYNQDRFFIRQIDYKQRQLLTPGARQTSDTLFRSLHFPYTVQFKQNKSGMYLQNNDSRQNKPSPILTSSSDSLLLKNRKTEPGAGRETENCVQIYMRRAAFYIFFFWVFWQSYTSCPAFADDIQGRHHMVTAY